jgi:GNAT superfamily N-acetyltransferase
VRAGGAFLAWNGGDAVGYALAWVEGVDAVKLGDLFVRPHDRGRGVGRALVRAVADLRKTEARATST